MLFAILAGAAAWAKSFFGMAFIVCSLISLALLLGEMVWYKIKKRGGKK